MGFVAYYLLKYFIDAKEMVVHTYSEKEKVKKQKLCEEEYESDSSQPRKSYQCKPPGVPESKIKTSRTRKQAKKIN